MTKRMFLLCTTVVSLFLVVTVSHSFTGFFSKHKTVKDANGEILIPLEDIKDGSAHHYQYKNGGQTVKFFIVQSDDGVIRAAFDACDVCFHAKKGYTQEGDYMICNNCGQKFHSSRINVIKGGCNPAPLDRAERGEDLVIRAGDILKGTKYF